MIQTLIIDGNLMRFAYLEDITFGVFKVGLTERLYGVTHDIIFLYRDVICLLKSSTNGFNYDTKTRLFEYTIMYNELLWKWVEPELTRPRKYARKQRNKNLLGQF